MVDELLKTTFHFGSFVRRIRRSNKVESFQLCPCSFKQRLIQTIALVDEQNYRSGMRP